MVLVAIPARIGGGVRRGGHHAEEIDHLGSRRRSQQVLDHGLRGRMRQRAEGQIERFRLPVDSIDRQQLGQRIGRELGEDLAHVLASAALGGKQRNLDTGMTDQESQQFGTSVAGPPSTPILTVFSTAWAWVILLAVECDDRTKTMRRRISGRCRGTSSGGTRDDYAR